MSALAEGVADPSATGVFARTPSTGNGPSIPIHWLLIMLLVGGGGGSVISSRLFSNDGSEALSRVAAVELQIADVQGQAAAVDALEGEVDRLEAEQDNTARMLRDQGRTLLWIVDSMQRQSAAIAALAKAEGVEVDLTAPPLLPVVDPRP
jgi:hypothetical protein